MLTKFQLHLSWGMFELVWKGAEPPHSPHLKIQQFSFSQNFHSSSKPEVEHILGHLVHEGPVLLAGDALALEPVLLLQTALTVVLRRVEEDRAVVLADLLSLQRWLRSTTQFSPNPIQ